jgi:hypothetical protein
MTQTHRRLTLAQQAYALRGTGQGNTKLKLDHLRHTVDLQPTSLSRSYECELQYRLGYPPDVRVLRPTLERNDEGALPHYFYESGTLCLYEGGEWNASMLLAATIIPWTIEWLFYYELWVATGTWHGSGIDRALPPPRATTSDAINTESQQDRCDPARRSRRGRFTPARAAADHATGAESSTDEPEGGEATWPRTLETVIG